MKRYVIKRILLMIPTLAAVVFIIYGIMELTPGEPARLILGTNASQEAVDELTIKLGYDQPFLIRYLKYLQGVFRGDLGESWRTGRPVIQEVFLRFPTTLKLAAISMLLAVAIGIPLGVISAVKQYSALDMAGTIFAMILASVPGFWLAMMLIIVFSVKLGWLPSFGTGTPAHYILPAISMACPEIAVLLRFTRTTMLETIRQDYVRTARAKGQRERLVITKHALPNALLPVITVTGTEFCGMLGGVVTIETVFSINGVGMLIYTAILNKDVPMVIGSTVFLSLAVMIVMAAIDILYAFIDPRIKAVYSGERKKR